jgi:hypothetical protein
MSNSIELDPENTYRYTILSGAYSFLLLLVTGSYLSLILVYPHFSAFSIAVQLIAINLWVYWIHRICHSLPNQVWNYHIYSHHNKLLNLSRPLELVCEFVTDFSWFLLLLAIKLFFKLEFLSSTLIVFVGLWYSSIHVLNLSLGNHIEHRIHHVDYQYNYGPAYIDFLFGTLKVDRDYTSDFEIPNGIAACLILLGLKQYIQFD